MSDSPLARHTNVRALVHSTSSPAGGLGVERDMVLSKCRSVIEALHEELEEERARGERLERTLLQERQSVRQLEARHNEHFEVMNQKLEKEISVYVSALRDRDAQISEQAEIMDQLQREISDSTRNLDTLAAEHSKVLADLAVRERDEQELRYSLTQKDLEVSELEKTVVAISEELLRTKTTAIPVPPTAWDEAKVDRLRAKLEHKILTLKLKLNDLLDHQEANNAHLFKQKKQYVQTSVRTLTPPLHFHYRHV